MSLSLVADYASDDEDAGQNGALSEDSADEAEREEQERIAAERDAQERRARARAAVEAQRALQSALPPPDSLFSEIKGPPAFLRPDAIKPVHEQAVGAWADRPAFEAEDDDEAPGGPVPAADGGADRKPKSGGAPTGAVISGAPVLIRDQEVEHPRPSTEPLGAQDARNPGVTMPNREEAAALLSACEKCGIPKTFSTALGGLVCPQCKGRAPGPPRQETGKRKGFVKDKEKEKRMKGQSVHASWKSEGEMLLRQQFD
ncbi:hypothetical protein KFL_000010390 [Klebsormidium nitens]|uniref:Uncharacterized protein n=1 Tax=Klebsormidium nitens TaxID=105231 RepID=A0A0U9HHJ3_KLENI|nr:hypothetical protein KFL_000010390 [Klebsormidium nitens]|eukprot:GAQ77590.1 hypothetical protein KFL_000010390 [Klebsormidium nitens]